MITEFQPEVGVGSRTEIIHGAQSPLNYENNLLYSAAPEFLSPAPRNAEKCATLKHRDPFTFVGETKKPCTVLETN